MTNKFCPIDEDGYVYLRLTCFNVGHINDDCYSIKSLDFLKTIVSNFAIDNKLYIENISPCNYKSSSFKRITTIDRKNVIGEIKDIEIREFSSKKDIIYLYGRVKLYGEKQFKHNSLSPYLYPRVLLSGNYVINIITFDLDDQFYEEYGKYTEGNK